MILSTLSKRERAILYITVGIICAVGLYSFAIEPGAKKWMEINGQILAKRVRFQKDLKLIAQRDEIQAHYARFASAIRKKGSDEEELASLLSEIETLARESAVHITGIKPRAVREMDFYTRYVVEVEAEALIDQLTDFLYNLSKSSQLLKVERLELNAKSGETKVLKSSLLATKVLIP